MAYTISDLRADMRSGEYAWPGGYQRFFVAHDGEALSFEAVKENLRLVLESIRDGDDDGWRVVACEINWESQDLFCAHTNKLIPSAYGE